MPEPAIDDLDRAVVHALQIQPRASWAQLAAVLDIDPATVARRWERMRAAGIAWVTAYPAAPHSMRGAMVEVDCLGRPLDVVEQLMDEPECLTIDVVSGGRDLMLTVVARDELALSDYVLSRLASVAGIRALRTHPITGVFAEGSTWRLNGLTDAQRERITKLRTRPAAPAPRPPLSPVEHAVGALLAEDGRMKAADVAARTGLPVRRAREIIAHLVSSGWVILRTDLSRSFSGWPVCAWYFLRAPSARVTHAAAQLATIDEIRAVIVTAAPHNIMAAVWMQSAADVTRLEARIESRLPGVAILDRCITLRPAKLVGITLDARGCRVLAAPTQPATIPPTAAATALKGISPSGRAARR